MSVGYKDSSRIPALKQNVLYPRKDKNDIPENNSLQSFSLVGILADFVHFQEKQFYYHSALPSFLMGSTL